KVLRRLLVVLRGSLRMLDGCPVALQGLYSGESVGWIRYEYINGGVDPRGHHLIPGSVLSLINTLAAWDVARHRGKALRYSFDRADRDYKHRWCNRVAAFRT
ncbi:MAG TPA: GNAT family N-acetyltransferase, partial [Pseudomonas sp.]|nr:GNAT family N-acetyltransferase [Pseudomonas sp.]